MLKNFKPRAHSTPFFALEAKGQTTSESHRASIRIQPNYSLNHTCFSLFVKYLNDGALLNLEQPMTLKYWRLWLGSQNWALERRVVFNTFSQKRGGQ